MKTCFLPVSVFLEGKAYVKSDALISGVFLFPCSPFSFPMISAERNDDYS